MTELPAFAMTVVDVVILGVTVIAIRWLLRDRVMLGQSGVFLGPVLETVGLSLVGLLTLADLVAIHLLPGLLPGEEAAAVVTRLRTEALVMTAVVALVLMVVGFGLTRRGLLRLVSNLDRTQGDLARETSARTQSEADLHATTQQYRFLVENAPVSIFDLDVEGRLISLNETGRRMLRVEAGEVRGIRFIDVVVPEDHPEVRGRMAAAVRGTPTGFEFRAAGAPDRVLSSNLLPTLGDDGAVVGLVGVTSDITERHLAEQFARRSRELLEATPDFVAMTDLAGQLRYLNLAGRRMVGLGDEESVEGLTIATFFSPATLSRYSNEAVPTALEAGVWSGETTLLTRAGDEVPLSQVVVAHRTPEGTDYLSTIGRDISERKEAERALERSEEYYRSLIENAQDIITVVDRAGRIGYQSPSSAWTLGYPPPDLVGRNVLDLIHPEDRERVVAATAHAYATPEAAQLVEFRFAHADGTWRTIESVGCVHLHDGGGAQGVVNSRDITDRRESEEERSRLEAQLRRAQQLETIGTLAGGVAHDFNNILTPIFGHIEMALQELAPDHAAVEDLGQVQTAALRAKGLVDQILTFSRQVERERSPVRLDEIVGEALRLLRASLPSTIEIREALNASDAVNADPTQMHQVLMNLCTNAFHAMREQGGVLTVALDRVQVDAALRRAHPTLVDPAYLRLTVEDTGHGMSPQVQRRIFDPFFTTKGAREGSGLGLSVVLGIVENHGGTLLVRSEVGVGTAFEVYLPRIDAATPVVATESAAIPRGTEHVLFVDDERAIADMAKRLLERLGYRVTVKTNSLDALAAFEDDPAAFDLVITDYTMPRMTGGELATRVLSIRPEAPVILMTGFSEAMTPERSRALGIREYVMKPVVARDLGLVIRRVLDEPSPPT